MIGFAIIGYLVFSIIFIGVWSTPKFNQACYLKPEAYTSTL